jgi:hypothetical protein
MTDPGVREKLKAWRSIQAVAQAEFGKRIDDDIEPFSEVVKAANLKFEE